MRAILIAVSFLIVIAACDSDRDLKKQIYIPDPQNPGLPLYTEEGYNTFGAYIEGERFWSDHTPPASLSFSPLDTTLTLKLDGKITNDYYYLSITFQADSIRELRDLASLKGKTLDLTDTTNLVYEFGHKIKVTTGTLTISNARFVNVDNTLLQVILSGTFNYAGADNTGDTTSATDGRFDIAFDELTIHL